MKLLAQAPDLSGGASNQSGVVPGRAFHAGASARERAAPTKETRGGRGPLVFDPPEEKVVKKEIKEIKVAAVQTPNLTQGRPSSPGGGLKIDLSSRGAGKGEELVSGGDRSGAAGIGNRRRQTETAWARWPSEPGQTDEDARIVGPDQALHYPPRAPSARASRVTWTCSSWSTSPALRSRSPFSRKIRKGMAFGAAAIEAVRRLRFQPAIIQKNPVRRSGQAQGQFRTM